MVRFTSSALQKDACDTITELTFWRGCSSLSQALCDRMENRFRPAFSTEVVLSQSYERTSLSTKLHTATNMLDRSMQRSIRLFLSWRVVLLAPQQHSHHAPAVQASTRRCDCPLPPSIKRSRTCCSGSVISKLKSPATTPALQCISFVLSD